MEAKNLQENPKLLRFQTFFSLDLLKSICAKIWILVRYLYVFLKGDLLYYASSLSFYTIFALLPMLLIVFSLVAAMPEFKENQTGGASPSPTVSDIICAFKSLSTLECKKLLPIDILFQRSYHDHIIRDDIDYQNIRQYIDENPIKWAEDKYNTNI